MILPVFKTGVRHLRGVVGAFDSHTLPPQSSFARKACSGFRQRAPAFAALGSRPLNASTSKPACGTFAVSWVRSTRTRFRQIPRSPATSGTPPHRFPNATNTLQSARRQNLDFWGRDHDPFQETHGFWPRDHNFPKSPCFSLVLFRRFRLGHKSIATPVPATEWPPAGKALPPHRVRNAGRHRPRSAVPSCPLTCTSGAGASPAEVYHIRFLIRLGTCASMRPQPCGCGNSVAVVKKNVQKLASMRPQPCGCGNDVNDGAAGLHHFSFNEAAAVRLRKSPRRFPAGCAPRSFNEAAAVRLRKLAPDDGLRLINYWLQ